jgi:type III pantothenate kinase
MTAPVLLLDIGNSRIKWALVRGADWLAEGAAPHDETARLLGEWDRFASPARIIAANVAGEDRLAGLSSYWQSRGVPLRCFEAAKACAGVHNLYDRPSQLGSDRWAALIGAWARTGSACLVVSAGTAVTIDALNGQGEFLGGMILPGRRLMLQSLSAGTHALEDLAGKAVDFPRNTADAMTSGIASALAGAVQAGHQRLASADAKTVACLITGGDAEWLARQLPFEAIIAPRLVLEGLRIMDQGDVR